MKYMDENTVLMTCVPGCEGYKDLCIPYIIDHLNNNMTVCMQYTVHVQDKLKELIDYDIVTKYHNNIPVLMYLTKKQETIKT